MPTTGCVLCANISKDTTRAAVVGRCARSLRVFSLSACVHQVTERSRRSDSGASRSAQSVRCSALAALRRRRRAWRSTKTAATVEAAASTVGAAQARMLYVRGAHNASSHDVAEARAELAKYDREKTRTGDKRKKKSGVLK